MRRMLLITLALLAVSLSVCTLSMVHVNRATEHCRRLRSQAILAMDAGDVQRAEETLVQLADYLDTNSLWMQIVCDHGDLHAIKGEIIDAQVSIEFGIEDDFYQAISRFGEGLEHIAELEKFSLSNIC